MSAVKAASSSFLLLVASLTTATAFAQSKTEKFLSTAWNDPIVELRQNNYSAFRDPRFVNPIDKLQLRLTQNEYFDDRKIGLRMEPRSFTEYRLINQLQKRQSSLEDLSLKQELSNSLKVRYIALITYQYALENQRAFNELVKNLKRTLSMVASASRTTIADAHDLLKVREDLEKAQAKLGAADLEVISAIRTLKELSPGYEPKDFDAKAWPKPQELIATIDRLNADMKAEIKSIDVALEKERASQVREELSLDIAKGSRLFDFFEITMSQDGDERRYGFEVGINIPGFSGSDYGSREKARELVKYEIEARVIEREQNLILKTTQENLKRLGEMYRVSTSTEFAATEERIKKLARRQDPFLANAIDRDSLERRLRANEALRDSYLSYFEYLAASGILGQRAKTNFLSPSLQDISL